MATNTTYKSLVKPLRSEKYNIDIFNSNADIIDEELHKLEVKNQEQDNLIKSATAKRAIVGQNGTDGTNNPWYKFASINIDNKKSYYDARISFKAASTYSQREFFGVLTAHVRTELAGKFLNGYLTWEYASYNIDTSKFILAYKETPDQNVDVELWVKVDGAYVNWIFEVIEEGSRTAHTDEWIMHNAYTSGQAESITEGYTQIQSTIMALAAPGNSTYKINKKSIVGQTGATTTDPWYKFASAKIDSQYSQSVPRITFKVESAGSSNNKYSGILTTSFYVLKNLTVNTPTLTWEYASGNIDTSRFVLAYKETDDSIEASLWV